MLLLLVGGAGFASVLKQGTAAFLHLCSKDRRAGKMINKAAAWKTMRTAHWRQKTLSAGTGTTAAAMKAPELTNAAERIVGPVHWSTSGGEISILRRQHKEHFAHGQTDANEGQDVHAEEIHGEADETADSQGRCGGAGQHQDTHRRQARLGHPAVGGCNGDDYAELDYVGSRVLRKHFVQSRCRKRVKGIRGRRCVGSCQSLHLLEKKRAFK